jgi:DnaK suppressor protein
MNTFEQKDAPSFELLLSQREQELRTALRALDHLPSLAEDITAHDVLDFKDVAIEDTLARLDRATAQRLEAELSQVISAQRRLAEHSYGKCLDCGELIDVRRLLALPASAYCAACQTTHEHEKYTHHQAL